MATEASGSHVDRSMFVILQFSIAADVSSDVEVVLNIGAADGSATASTPISVVITVPTGTPTVRVQSFLFSAYILIFSRKVQFDEKNEIAAHGLTSFFLCLWSGPRNP